MVRSEGQGGGVPAYNSPNEMMRRTGEGETPAQVLASPIAPIRTVFQIKTSHREALVYFVVAQAAKSGFSYLWLPSLPKLE